MTPRNRIIDNRRQTRGPLLALVISGALTGCPAITDAELAARIDQDADGYISSQFGGADCDDKDASVHPDAPESFYDGVDQDCDGASDYDADGDGADSANFGGTDCDDTLPTVHPGAEEICDGFDNNCDGVALSDEVDNDGDGWMVCEEDCNDSDPEVNPGVPEICDEANTDEDCDGNVDDGDLDAQGMTAWYQDDDQDGYGDPEISRQACDEPVGFVDNDDDCNDSDTAINPETWWYGDNDADGYGDSLDATQQCEQPWGHVLLDTDCNDSDASVNPGQAELCGGGDEDCDGMIDEDDAEDAAIWYADDDGDGYGDSENTTTACDEPGSYTDDDSDCDDSDSDTHPGADEHCGGGDDDCDGLVDDDDPDVTGGTAWYLDSDADGYGDDDTSVTACAAPSGYQATGGDCDDTDSGVNPGASELCGGGDEDCDGTVDENDAADATTWYADTDNDGYGDPWTHTTSCSQPPGYLSDATDCDDQDDDINPGATEICNEEDDDCDGLEDDDDPDLSGGTTWYLDADGDGYGDSSGAVFVCEQPSGYVSSGTDCDDSDSSAYPSAVEACGDGVDNDCDGTATGCAPSGQIDAWDADAMFYGEVAWDKAGESVSFAGDVNADGYDDIIIGARYSDGVASSSGLAYLVLGPATGEISLASADARLLGEAEDDYAGQWVDGAGDVDGDGYDDVLVGAPYNDLGGAEAGVCYLARGPLSGDIDLGLANARLIGEASGDMAGMTVTKAGDIDSDGFADLLVSAPYSDPLGSQDGTTYVVSGPITGDVGLASSGARIYSDNSYQLFSRLTSNTAGDTNGDGLQDFLIGAPYHREYVSPYYNWGISYLFLGPQSGDIPMSSADGVLKGEDDNLAGRSVASAGDVNADGYDDILIGAHCDDGAADNAGAVYLVLGPVSGELSLRRADSKLEGESEDDNAGWSVAPAGDTDLDGFDDILIGAYHSSSGATYAGVTYLVRGPITANIDLATADATWVGENSDDNFGQSIAGDFDVDSDGFNDVLIAAPANATAFDSAGTIYLFLSPGW